MKKYPKSDWTEVLLESLATGDSSTAITNQEKRGQEQLASSDVLPRKVNSQRGRADLEDMGIVFGEFADDLFIYCILPAGWKINPTDHSMWSELVDDKGKKRAMIFYKAAFYDRDAFVSISK